jgi:hypothetical protein
MSFLRFTEHFCWKSLAHQLHHAKEVLVIRRKSTLRIILWIK